MHAIVFRSVSSSHSITFYFIRAALNACGWGKKYGALRNLLDGCESRGEFERSAALAIWHGNLEECVA